MIVSTRYRFVFLDMPKCTFTAIEETIRPLCSIILQSEIKQCNMRHYERFIEPLLKINHIDPSGFTIYALFREPVDWLHSWWRYLSAEEIARPADRRRRRYGNLSFAQYVEQYIEKEVPALRGAGPQERVVIGQDGTTDRVKLFRYEDIAAFQSELETQIGRRLNIDDLNVLPTPDGDVGTEVADAIRAAIPRDFAVYDSIPQRAGPNDLPHGRRSDLTSEAT